MSTIHLVAPEHREIATAIALFEPNEEGLKVFRRGIVEGLTSLVSPTPTDHEIAWVPAEGERPSVRVVIHKPDAMVEPVPAILYLHGGGLIAGTPDMMNGANQELARTAGVCVFAPAYRLAPEAPFLAALEDAYATLLWVHNNARVLGVDPSRISVMGWSAGGGLAAALAILTRDRGVVSLRSQLLLYPGIDIRTGAIDAPSDDPSTGEFIWGRPQNEFAWTMALGSVAKDDPRIGYLSAALTQDLANLPPTFITAGSLDLYRDEDIAYAQRLMRHGVAAELVIYSGAVHLFDAMPGSLGDRARNDLIASVRRLA